MSSLNSFDLFEKNPQIHSQFPFLTLDVNNNNNCIPPRMKFHEMHWHDELQLTYVINGVIQVITIYQTLEFKKNEAAFINKKILHQITEIENAHYKSFLFPDIFMQFYDNSPIYKQVSQFLNNYNLTILSIQDKTLIDLVHQLNSLTLRKKDSFYEYQILLLVNQFILELMKSTKLPEKNIHLEQNLCIQECLTFIHEHYDEDITLEQIASFGNISVGYCGRLFKKVLNISPYEYLIDFRIKKSLDLLASSQYTISQIARMVGFNSLSHFIQCFKKKLDTTPKQYQKALFKKQVIKKLTVSFLSF